MTIRSARSPRPSGALRLALALIAVLPAAAALTAALAPAHTSHAAGKVTARAATSSLGDRVNARLGLVKSRLTSLPLGAVAGRPLTITIPLDGTPATVDLIPHSIRASGFRVRVQRDDGTLVDVEPGPVRTLLGEVRGKPGSRVHATLGDDGVRAVVVVPGAGTFWIEPVAHLIDGPAPGTHVVYKDVDVIESGGVCGSGPEFRTQAKLELARLALPALAGAGAPAGTSAGTAPGGSTGGSAAGAAAASDGTLYQCAEIACDADWQYFQDYGSVEAVQTRIESIINAVNSQFQDEVGISHNISEIIIRTSAAANPYTTNDASDLLDQFRSQWLANHADVVRDVAHLFTGRNLDGGTVGIAWIGAVCGGDAYGVVQSDCCGPFSCTTDLSAHELGHNWGADHCSCPSYTMNSGITCSNRFNPVGTIPDILAYRDFIAFCLEACDGTGIPVLYCTAAGGTATFEHIARVQLGSIDQSSGAATYTDFTSITTELELGTSTSCTITLGSPFSTDVGGIWVDWNRDRDFDDAGEAIAGSLSGTGPYVATIIVPIDATPGPTRLRVRIQDGAADPTPIPCGLADFGEVEDYTIVVVEPTGACCLADGTCATVTAAGCLASSGDYAGDDVDCVTAACPAPCPADIDGNGDVGFDDLLSLLFRWGPCPGCPEDVDGNGSVDFGDLLEVLFAWGPCG